MTQGLEMILLAATGGTISILLRHEAANWRQAVLGGLGAGFAGYLVMHLCHAAALSDDWTAVFVGVSGWMGAARTLTMLEAIFDARFRITPKTVSAEKQARDLTDGKG